MKPLRELINNDNERLKHSFNINDIEEENPYYVDQIADWLVRELNSPDSHDYYCKIARLIPKYQLNNMLTCARNNGRKPAHLFTHLTQKYLKNKGLKK